MNTGKAVLGVLAGIAAGAAIGVLVAPRKADRPKIGLFKEGEDIAEAINKRIDEKFDALMDSMYTQTSRCRPKEDQFDGE
jgi:gas vesicle protein